MALKMKEDPDDIKDQSQESGGTASGNNGMGEGFIDMTDPFYADNASNATYVVKSTYIPKEKEKSSPVVKVVIFAVVAIIILAAGFMVYKKFLAKYDITSDIMMSEAEFEAKYGISFEENAAKANGIPRYTRSKVTVRDASGLSLVYVDGKRVGTNTDTSRYYMYGIKLGDPAYQIDKTTSFRFDDKFNVLNDLEQGSSSVDYYANKSTNECLAITVNDNSGRVVAITYYNDFKKMTEDLVFDE